MKAQTDLISSAGTEENPAILPAQVTVTVEESALSGDLAVYNGSSINFSLQNYSSWIGKAYSASGTSYVAVHFDATSEMVHKFVGHLNEWVDKEPDKAVSHATKYMDVDCQHGPAKLHQR